MVRTAEGEPVDSAELRATIAARLERPIDLELERSHAVDIGGVSLFLSSSRMVGGFLSSGALLALDAADKCQMFIWM